MATTKTTATEERDGKITILSDEQFKEITDELMGRTTKAISRMSDDVQIGCLQICIAMTDKSMGINIEGSGAFTMLIQGGGKEKIIEAIEEMENSDNGRKMEAQMALMILTKLAMDGHTEILTDKEYQTLKSSVI